MKINTGTLEKPYEPQEVDQVDIAFPANVRHLVPDMKDIPKEFHRMGETKWNKIFSD